MIKNERQYRVTKGQLDRFKALVEDVRARHANTTDVLLRDLELSAAEAQVEELTTELDEYDNLRNGLTVVEPLGSLADLPLQLIRTRIALGLTQRDLAGRLGMPEQQVQRYEANNWSTASLSRLVEVADALDIAVGGSVIDSVPQAPSSRDLKQQLRKAGLDAQFVQRRLAPAGDEERGEELGTVLDLAARVHRIYKWSPSDVLSGHDLDLDMPVAVGFKLPARVNEPRTRAYTVYAHYLSLLTIDATRSLPVKPIPPTAAEFRAAILEQYGAINFASVLDFVWDLGIPVLPLGDTGGFHGVLFRSEGRNVVVLKQQTRSPSRWVFDLLHEARHALEDLQEREYAVIDDEDTDVTADDEAAANGFAGDVLLDGRAEELAHECASEVNGRLEYLKKAVPRVAARNGVAVADLANYLAYRLSLEGENWWGTAANLQDTGVDPWATARDEFLTRTDLRVLNPLDRGLLTQALAE